MKPRALNRYKTGKHRGKTIPSREIRRRQLQSLKDCGMLVRLDNKTNVNNNTEFV